MLPMIIKSGCFSGLMFAVFLLGCSVANSYPHNPHISNHQFFQDGNINMTRCSDESRSVRDTIDTSCLGNDCTETCTRHCCTKITCVDISCSQSACREKSRSHESCVDASCARKCYFEIQDPNFDDDRTTVEYVLPSNPTKVSIFRADSSEAGPRVSRAEMLKKYQGTYLDEAAVYGRLIAMKKKYPEGMRWTIENYYDWKGNNSGGRGCIAFAFILSDAAFSLLPARTHRNFRDLRVGDVLAVTSSDPSGHAVIILSVDDKGVHVAEGNLNSAIHWGRRLTFNEIKKIGTEVLTRYPE